MIDRTDMDMTINRKRLAILAACTCLLLPVSAQQQTYTLQQCLDEAMANNVRMKTAANELSAARHTQQEAFTNYFPTVSATGSGYMADEHLVSASLGPGMDMAMLKNGVVGGVTAAMPLFTGGQIVNGNKLSKVGVEVSRLKMGVTENEVKLTTQRYYWQTVMLKEKLKTIDQVQKQLEKLVDDVQASVDAGVATRNDLLQVQLKQNEMRSNRISVENLLSVSVSLLAQYIGHAGDSIDISYALDSIAPQHPAELYRLPEAALPITNEHRLLTANVRAAKLQQQLAVGKCLPTVALGGGYVYDNLMDKDQSFWIGFATVSVPLTKWWGGSHDIKKQKLQVANARYELQDKSELLMINMQNTWNQLNDAWQQVGIAQLSITQAAENLRLNTDYYTAGTCTMSDLLEAQTLYRQSRDQYIEAYADYELKKCEYLQVTGR